MTNETTKHPPETRRSRRKWPWITLAVILLVLGTARYVIQADWFFNQLRPLVENQANEVLNGELEIARLSGDLLSHINVEGVHLRDEERNTVAEIERISLEFSLWEVALSPHTLKKLEISSLRADLVEDERGWNILNILPEMQEETIEEEDAGQMGVIVRSLNLENHRISITSPALPDGFARIDELNMNAGLEFGPERQSVQLDHLGFKINEGRLDEPLEMITEAELDDGRITLESLTLTGAHTLLESAGHVDLDSEEFDVQAFLRPLGRRDVEPYVEDWPVMSDVSLSLSSSGNFTDFEAGISFSADGLEYVDITAGISTGSPLGLHALKVETGPINPQALIGEDLPQLQHLLLDLEGFVPLEEYEQGNLSGNLAIRQIAFEDYGVDRYSADLAWNGAAASIEQLVTRAGEEIAIDLSVTELFDRQNWQSRIEFRDIDLQTWLNDESLQSSINGTFSADGTGFDLTEEYITYQLDFDRFALMGEEISRLEVAGRINDAIVDADSRIVLREGEIQTQIFSYWNRTPVSYSVDSELSGVNLSSLSLLEDLPTDLNLSFSADGEGLSPEELDLTGTLAMKPSEINQHRVDSLQASFGIADTVITVEESYVESEIADASLTTRSHLLDYTDGDNRLDFELTLKDLQPFAALAGVQELNARGDISGTVQPDEEGRLVYDSELALSDIAYDTLYVSQINGQVTSLLTTAPEYDLNLEVLEPRVGDMGIQDLRFETSGTYREERLVGNYRLNFNISAENGLVQHAGYDIAGDDVRLTTETLTLFDPNIEYLLNEPFDITYNAEGLVVDTLHLAAADSSELSLAFSQGANGDMQGYLSGQQTDVSVLQAAFMDEPMVEGLLSGTTEFRVAEDELRINSDNRITEFNYRNLKFDQIALGLNIAGDRLETDFTIVERGDHLAEARFELPFKPMAPEELDEAFFEEQVSGFFTIHPVELSRFNEFLEEIDVGPQAGTLAMDTRLSGVAGSPDFYGDLVFYDGALSGVEVDSLNFGWDYSHTEEKIEFTADFQSLGQHLLDLDGTLPFYADFQEFNVEVPGDDDEFEINLKSTDFRLAAFNDFVDASVARDIEGLLNADLALSGTVGTPELEGNLSLTRGNVFLVPNNIRIRRIRVDLGVRPGRLTLNAFQAESNGVLRGSGGVELDGFTPESFDISLEGNNLSVFDTDEIQALVGLDTRITGTVEEPRLTGTFRVNRGSLSLDNFGEQSVEEVHLDYDDEEDLLTTGEEVVFIDRMAIEMTVSMGRNVFLRNRRDPELDLTLSGDLEVVKDHFGPLQVFGDLNIPSGYVTTILNKRFDIESGSVMFSGDPEDPELDIRALYQPRQQMEEIFIWYIITGPVSDPEFAYESEPEMEFQDIISYTLFGRPFEALAGWERTVTGRGEGSLAADIALDILLDRVEMLASNSLGIDVIEIDNSRSNMGGGTSVKAGKFLTDRIFVAYLQELGGTRAARQVMLEYMINRNLELSITASDDYRSGVDLMWKYDY